MNVVHLQLSIRRLQGMLWVLLSCAGGLAHATSVCVSTSNQLQSALSNASSQTDAYTIRIVASPTPYQLGPNNQILGMPPNALIRGGYAPGCGSRYDDAAGTVIDFGGYPVGLYPADGSSAQRLEIDNLTLQHGGVLDVNAGIVGDFSDEVGTIIIQNARFSDFVSNTFFGTPVGFHAVKGLVQLVDVQFDHLQQNDAPPCAVTIYGDNNSTFTANFVTADLADSGSNKNFCLAASDQSGTFTARIDNSIIWGSANFGTTAIQGLDPSQNGHPIHLSTHNSIYGQFTGWGTATAEVAHVSADPHWVNPAADDYRLADPASPAVNSGDAGGALGAPYYDIARGLRVIGSHPDRGAYESPFDDSTTLVVQSAADDGGPFTLRTAITNANLFGGYHTIAFNLPTCPAVIQLATPLPDITSAMTVDGYTQPGAIPNDSDLSFDANLCVLIKPVTSAVAAFRVPTNANGGTNASLTLQGLGIGGFGQDVILLGGTNHAIRGNQFGGVANGVDLGSTSLNIISVGVDADSFLIGGFGPQNRNVIGGAEGGLGNGINIQSGVVSDTDHCQIVNNWIGLAPDLTALPNEYGVQVSGSGCAVYDNRITSSTLGNLWINGGHGNVVQHNIIADTSGLPNDAFGIRIDGNNNTIGSSATGTVLGTLFTNAVTDMVEGGIIVTSGSGNSIRGNYVSWNGPNQDGAGMDIDLGGDGPTANGSHAPPGPNDWQEFPMIDRLVYLGHPPGGTNTPAAIVGHLDGAAGTYTVDGYYSNGCGAATGRAHPEAYLGDTTVTIPAGQSSATFTFEALLPSDVTGNLGLTATSAVSGTSEIGACFSLANGVDDRIFHSGFGTGAEY